MASTYAEWIDGVRSHLRGLVSSVTTALSVAANNSTTTLTVAPDPATIGGIGVGSVVEIDTELCLVTATTATTLTVVRGWAGSTAASHLINAPVRANPPVTGVDILRALNDTLNDMSSRGLLREINETLTADGDKAWFAVTTSDVERVLAVHARSSSDNSEPFVQPRWSERHHLPAGVAAEGVSIQFERIYATGTELYAVLGQRLPAAALSVDVTTSPVTAGVAAIFHDVAALGAAVNVLEGEEANRSLTAGQSSSRRATEVPPGSLAAAADVFRREYNRRVAREVNRFEAKFPPRGQLRANL